MDIKERFLELTSRTYPHGTEKELNHLLCDGLQEDEFENLFIKIGESDTMFAAHLDTATGVLSEITHEFNGNIISTDGSSILGSDDKAGVVIMLHMIENNVPGLYYFFIGEEVGCVGSRKVAGACAANTDEKELDKINKVISFDRRGTTSIITHQSSKRTCSDKFGEALSQALNVADENFAYKNDSTGTCTDSLQFIKLYSECTNISVGYKNEHTYSETQDIDHLEKLAKACVLVDWESLPVERDFTKTEYKTYGGYGGGYMGGYGDWDDDYYGGMYGSGGGYKNDNKYSGWNQNSKYSEVNEKVYIHDKTFNYVCCIELKSGTKKIVSVDLDAQRVSYEKAIIDDLLKSLELDYTLSKWDGFKLEVFYGDKSSTDCDRNDLIEYLPEFDYTKKEQIID